MNSNNLKPLAKKLPSEINDHILELLNRPADKTKFESDGNSVRIQKIIGSEVMNIEVKQYPHGKEVTQSVFNHQGPKANLEETVKQMADEGVRNKDIADLLDISPSYASKLKRK